MDGYTSSGGINLSLALLPLDDHSPLELHLLAMANKNTMSLMGDFY
ncbi:MAG: hypothetical protein AAGF93_06455 [Cyanobacteria bacterium P01_H01_bin.105]